MADDTDTAKTAPFGRAQLAVKRELDAANTDPDVFWHDLDLRVVRAVIEAIREPNSEMQRAASNRKVSFHSASGMSDIGQVSVEYEAGPDKGAATLWTAMIDALLADGV